MVQPSSRVTWHWLLGLALLCGEAARADEAEDKAVAFFQKIAKVIRDEKAPGQPVVGVYLLEGLSPVTNQTLKELAPFKNLENLSLFNTKVSDAGMKELVGFKKLLVFCKP
jgi:hypothetical protein